MEFTNEQLRVIFKQGRCSRCHKEIWFSHFGRHQSPWGWHVEKAYSISGVVDPRMSHPSCYACVKEKPGQSAEHDSRKSGINLSHWPG
jgi:hypothetical protein